MKISREIRGFKYTYANELYIIVKRTFNSIPKEQHLEFAGSYLECKKEIMHIAALVSQGLYLDEPIPGEDYQGIGIYSQEEVGLRLVYSIYRDYFTVGIDNYDIVKVEDEVALIVELGKEYEFFLALMNFKEVQIIDRNGKRIIGYSQKLELKCKEYIAGNAVKECQTTIFSELWRKRMDINGPAITYCELN